MKKLILILIVISIFIIYILTVDRKIYYLTLGDELSIINYDNNDDSASAKLSNYLSGKNKLEVFINNFSRENYHITDVINDINNNTKTNHNNKDISIKNALIKADLLTISIGMNDITAMINIKNINTSDSYEFLYNDIDKISDDLDQLLYLLRKYCKENIILIGLYYPFNEQNQELTNIFLYANNKFKTISEQYNINYIDIYHQFLENENYLSSKKLLYPSSDGYNAIYDQLVVTINNTMLKNS